VKLDLHEKRVCIFGLQGSGKTEWLRWLCRNSERPFIVDPLEQYQDIPHAIAYVPKHKVYSPEAIAEINQVVKYMLTLNPRPTIFCLDEANRWCPNKRPLPEQLSYLNDEQRHLNLALAFIARRPAQLNTDLTELAHFLVVFNLAGKNDRQYLNDLAENFGDQAVKLPWHDFLIADPQRQVTHYPALQLT